jgi:histidinol phosphatase-like enzyme
MNAKEVGSLIEIKNNIDFDNLESKIENILNSSKNTLSEILILDSIKEEINSINKSSKNTIQEI